MKLFTRKSAASVGVLIAALVTFGSSPAIGLSDNSEATEITGSPEANAMVQDFRDKLNAEWGKLESAFMRNGLNPADAEYRVFTNIPGDSSEAVWIVPAGSEIPTVTRDSDGVTTIDYGTTSPEAASDVAPLSGNPDMMVPFGSPVGSGYSWQSSKCTMYYPNSESSISRCTQWGKVTSDGSSTRDYWGYAHWATCYTTLWTGMHGCEVYSSLASSSPATQWQDWSPKSDTNGSCRSIGIGISLAGFGASGAFDTCEEHKIVKGSSAGTFRSKWGSFWPQHGSRGTEYLIGISIAQNKLPVFNAGGTWIP